MSLLWLSGFDHSTTVLHYFDNHNGFYIHATAGRRGGGATYENNWQNWGQKNLPARAQWYFGGAFMKGTGTPSVQTAYPVLGFQSSTFNWQVKVCMNGSSQLVVYNGSNTLLGTATPFFSAYQWYYVELYAKAHATAGELILRINEQVNLNLTNINTDPQGTGDFGRLHLGAVPPAGDYTRFDDVYVDDAQFHGNSMVKTFMPTGDSGTHAAWTRSGGSNDYEMVDETAPDDDTTYIKSTAKGDKSAFTITPGTLGTIKGIQIGNRVRAVVGALRRSQPFIRQDGADYRLPILPVSTDNYKTHRRIVETDPSDGQPWNDTKLGTAEFGIEHKPLSTTTSTTSTTTTT